jgi:hypothetical protein
MQIWLVTPAGYAHNECNREYVESFRDAFRALGYASEVVSDHTRLNVNQPALIIGAQLLSEMPLPKNWIIFQTEQVSEGSSWLKSAYMNHLRNQPIWDYSHGNIEELAKLGITAHFCELGYMPGLTRIAPAPAEDIDILFSGSMNERRAAILKPLQDKGIKLQWLPPGPYGKERDGWMARAKIILNLHFYEAKIFEIFRCGYAMANRKCIVSETGLDLTLEQPYYDGIAFTGYNGLIDSCLKLLADEPQRKALADRGFEIFSARNQVDIFKSAMEQTSKANPLLQYA